MAIHVMLVDDHKMLREGIKQLLEFDSEIVVSRQASNAEECISVLKEYTPDVLLLDINLPDMTGLQLLKEIRKKNKKLKILMLTVHNETEYLIDALDVGTDGYILKDSGSDELIRAIKSVYRGVQFIEPSMIPALNFRLVQKETESSMLEEMTRREKEILISIANGCSNMDIAQKLNISERTVKNHITNLFKKIGVKDRTQAAVFAIRNDLV